MSAPYDLQNAVGTGQQGYCCSHAALSGADTHLEPPLGDSTWAVTCGAAPPPPSPAVPPRPPPPGEGTSPPPVPPLAPPLPSSPPFYGSASAMTLSIAAVGCEPPSAPTSPSPPPTSPFASTPGVWTQVGRSSSSTTLDARLSPSRTLDAPRCPSLTHPLSLSHLPPPRARAWTQHFFRDAACTEPLTHSLTGANCTVELQWDAPRTCARRADPAGCFATSSPSLPHVRTNGASHRRPAHGHALPVMRPTNMIGRAGAQHAAETMGTTEAHDAEHGLRAMRCLHSRVARPRGGQVRNLDRIAVNCREQSEFDTGRLQMFTGGTCAGAPTRSYTYPVAALSDKYAAPDGAYAPAGGCDPFVGEAVWTGGASRWQSYRGQGSVDGSELMRAIEGGGGEMRIRSARTPGC